jgi:hypothetical protein
MKVSFTMESWNGERGGLREGDSPRIIPAPMALLVHESKKTKI